MKSEFAVASIPALRRRRRDQALRERTSLSLRADVLEAAKEIVQAGQAENLSAFVEDALEEKVRRTRRAALYAAYAEAANDPAFLRDMDDVSNRFSNADTDGL